MAKCTVCSSRKGKRKCRATETFICSLCCGESRSQEKCEGCSFFRDPYANRNYRSVSHYSTKEMADNPALSIISRVVEASLCQIWADDPNNVDDRTAARLVELLIDKYYFNDKEPRIDTPAMAECLRLFSQNINKELTKISSEQLVKVLAAVYRSIQRRTVGGSSYLQFVSQFTGVGPRV